MKNSVQLKSFATEINGQLSHLYAFARKINELDFAAALHVEFRGARDAGWSTTITANEVFAELCSLSQKAEPFSRAEYRVALMLYCQLSEAGGTYESLKNIMGIVTLKPYLLWPFKDLVRVKKIPPRVIGPNANATFRDLVTTAKSIGLSRLSSLLEQAFRDDIRNAISHSDYVLWGDELRLCNRNGGHAKKLSIGEVNSALSQGIAFFQVLREYNATSIQSFNPAKTIVGRLSDNFPMPWTVSYAPTIGSFQISGSSPGQVTTPTFDRQVNINSRLGGKAFATYSVGLSGAAQEIVDHMDNEGFEPNIVVMDKRQLDSLADDIDNLGLWDDRRPSSLRGEVLVASPWGFRWLSAPREFNAVLEKALLDFDME